MKASEWLTTTLSTLDPHPEWRVKGLAVKYYYN